MAAFIMLTPARGLLQCNLVSYEKEWFEDVAPRFEARMVEVI